MTNEAVPRRRGRVGGIQPAGRDDLTAYVAKDLDTTKADAALIVNSVTQGIAELSRRSLMVRVPNLGNFRVLDTPSREGRNPRTGEIVRIEPGRRVSFRATRSLKDAVNNSVRAQ